jgi:hypothetical protein
MVRERDGVFTLVERYDRKRKFGRYRSVVTLERGIERYGERQMLRTLREMQASVVETVGILADLCRNNDPKTITSISIAKEDISIIRAWLDQQEAA